MPGSAESRTVLDGDGPFLDRLDRAFDRSFARWRQHVGPIGLLFSGGVDSSLLAWELRANPDLRLVTVAVRDGADLESARSAAAEMGIRWGPSEVDEEDIQRTARRLAEEFGPMPPTSRDVLVAFSLALDRSPEAPVVCGQGADELFLGYAHFRGLGAEDAERRAQRDLASLRDVDWPRAQRAAKSLGREVSAPYLATEFARAALSVPVERRLPAEEPKRLFRAWAIRRGLPPAIARRPKRALQFGSGVARVLRRKRARTVSATPE